MTAVIELPKDRGNSSSLADWMEVNAFLDLSDHSSSIEDIVSELKLSNEASESLKTDIASELLERLKKNGEVYPFSFNGQLLEIKNYNNFDGQWAYILCLLISYVGVQNGEKKIKLWKQLAITSLFEKVSGIAAKNFLACDKLTSELLYFGAPRASWAEKDRPFRSALKILETKIEEGSIKEMGNASKQKDAGLDILAWRSFPDRRPGKMILLGQCAAGQDHKSKKYELRQFKNFFDIKSPYFQGFFIPHELNKDDWQEYCFDNDVGITFDRSRISFYASEWDGCGLKEDLDLIIKKISLYKKAF